YIRRGLLSCPWQTPQSTGQRFRKSSERPKNRPDRAVESTQFEHGIVRIRNSSASSRRGSTLCGPGIAFGEDEPPGTDRPGKRSGGSAVGLGRPPALGRGRWSTAAVHARGADPLADGRRGAVRRGEPRRELGSGAAAAARRGRQARDPRSALPAAPPQFLTGGD